MMPNQKQFQSDQASPAVSWQQRVMQPYNAIARQLKEIFSGGLLTTTLLLQFIWFTNALAYYGLVLLTTSVSPPWLVSTTQSKHSIRMHIDTAIFPGLYCCDHLHVCVSLLWLIAS